MNSFSGEGKYLGNNIPHGQGKVEQEQKEKLSPNIKRILVVDDDPDFFGDSCQIDIVSDAQYHFFDYRTKD